MQCRQRRKQPVGGDQMLYQCSHPAELCHLLKRIALFQCETMRHRPAERRHHSAAAQRPADIRQQGTDIRSLAAGHRQHRRLLFLVPFFQGDVIHLHRPRRAVDHDTLSCQLIEPLSLDGDRRIHGRDLLDLSQKPGNYFVQHFLCHVHLRIRRCPDSPHIFGVGLPAELYRRTIRLGLIRQDIAGTCCLSHQHRQHTGRHRVQRPRVSQPPHMQNTTQLADHVKGGEFRGLIHAEYTLHCVQIHALLHSFCTASSRMLRTSSAVPQTWHPAAFT